MARNGSGTYERAVADYVYNTTINQNTVNQEMDDIANALTGSLAKNGETVPTANLPMGTYRHTGVGNGSARTDYAALGQVQDGKANWVDGGGTADAITATYSPVITALVDGQLCYVRATAANATTTPTFSPNGLTARTIVKTGGVALAVGDIVGDGHELALRYDLTNTRWELLNPNYQPLDATLTAIADESIGAFSYRNKIINGGFAVNQRAYVSGAAVGAGLYGHDRWKMAASGDTYTFSTTANKTTVTIPASKVLQQVVEGLSLQSGTYVLTWEGTAQGKIGAGSLSASGVTGSITGGTDTTIEFGPGTVANVQLEFGSVATPFEQRPYGTELALCQRYTKVMRVSVGFSAAASSSVGSCTVSYAMRAAPTVTAIGTALATNVANHLYENISETGLRTTVVATAAGDTYSVRDVLLTAEL